MSKRVKGERIGQLIMQPWQQFVKRSYRPLRSNYFNEYILIKGYKFMISMTPLHGMAPLLGESIIRKFVFYQTPPQTPPEAQLPLSDFGHFRLHHRGGSRIFEKGGGVQIRSTSKKGGARRGSNFGPNVKKPTSWHKRGGS